MKKKMMNWEFEKLEGYTANKIELDGEIIIHAVNDDTKTAYTQFPNQRAYHLNEYDYVKQVIELHAKGLY